MPARLWCAGGNRGLDSRLRGNGGAPCGPLIGYESKPKQGSCKDFTPTLTLPLKGEGTFSGAIFMAMTGWVIYMDVQDGGWSSRETGVWIPACAGMTAWWWRRNRGVIA